MAAVVEPLTRPEAARTAEVPVRVVVYNTPSFHDAQAAARELGRRGISDREINVVAVGLRWVADVDRGAAAARMARAGSVLGAVVAFAFWAFGLGDGDLGPFLLAVLGGAIGGVCGFLVGAWRHWWTEDDESVRDSGHLAVARYDVLVDETNADRARLELEPA